MSRHALSRKSHLGNHRHHDKDDINMSIIKLSDARVIWRNRLLTSEWLSAVLSSLLIFPNFLHRGHCCMEASRTACWSYHRVSGNQSQHVPDDNAYHNTVVGGRKKYSPNILFRR